MLHTDEEAVERGASATHTPSSSNSILIPSRIRDNQDQMGGQMGQFLVIKKGSRSGASLLDECGPDFSSQICQCPNINIIFSFNQT
jgi:hypothetical protein